MITYIRGDINNSKMQTVAISVNCSGVIEAENSTIWGKLPEVYKDYRQQLTLKILRPGKPFTHKRSNGAWILSFPIKDSWQKQASLKIIEDGLRSLATNYRAWGITSLALPALGCDRGELSWGEVKPLIVKHLSALGIPIEVYEPQYW